MRPRPGYTLVEMMIAVACLGILLALTGLSSREWRRRAQATLTRERAVLLLEYEADCLAAGRVADPLVEARLKEPLRGAAVEARPSAEGTLVTVRWAGPRGQVVSDHTESLSLLVFTPGAR